MAIDNNADFTPSIPDSGVVPTKLPYNPTGSFKFWAQKVIPLVYDDSLSYYEVLCKVVTYLNNVIQNVDNLNDSVDSTNASFATLENYVNTTKDALLNAYNELQSYVNTYFDNLDVQDEINAKLDDMADSGELSDLLSPFIPNLVTAWLNANVDPVGSAVAVDSSLSITGAAGDARQTGIIRSIVTSTDDNEYIPVTTEGYINLNVTHGTVIDIEHPVSANNYHYAIVECSEGDIFTLNGTGGNAPRVYGFVDSDNKLLTTSPSSYTANCRKTTAPANAAKLIVNYNTSNPYSWLLKGDSVKNRIDSALLLDRNRITRLYSGADLNELVEPGNYYIGSTTDAQGVSNVPIQRPGRLTVMTLMYNVPMQVYNANISGKGTWYYRLKNNANPWSDWVEISTFKTGDVYYKMIEFETTQEYPYTQGFCITDKYIYIANLYDNTSEVVYQFDKYTFEKITEIEFTGEIKHAQDFAWDGENKRIYIAIGGGTKDIKVFTEEMVYVSTITINQDIVSLQAISRDPVSGLWVVGGGDNHKLYVFENLTDETPITTIVYDAEHADTQIGTYQGVSFVNNVIYGVVSNGVVTALSLNGDVIDSNIIGNAYGETENIQIINKELFYNIHDHSNMTSLLFGTSLSNITNNPILLA